MGFVSRVPLWARYVMCFAVAAVLFILLVSVVHDHRQEAEGLPATPSRAQLKQEQEQDTTLVEQQQAPHVSTPATGASGSDAAAAAVTAFMTRQIDKTFIAGPLDRKAVCSATGASAGRRAFRCDVTAGGKDNTLRYPFDVVVASSPAKVTFCQVVTPPLPSVKEPAVSSACR